MIHPLFEGIILGITISITLGPALIALLQTSIKHGTRRGIALALGIFTSDLTIVIGCFFGASTIITNPTTHMIFGIFGGIILIGFGLFNLTRKMETHEQVEVINEIRVKKPALYRYYAKGFLLNISNPFLWGFWLTSALAITSTYHGNRIFVLLFFSGTLGTVLLTDIIKVILAKKIKVTSNPSLKLWVNRIVGLVFFFFGLFVLICVVFDIPISIK
ncbi:MAG: LysE family transporter [Bacteroidota bacterium]|nr:LysE family transporter [Bacteroidota bacterium]